VRPPLKRKTVSHLMKNAGWTCIPFLAACATNDAPIRVVLPLDSMPAALQQCSRAVPPAITGFWEPLRSDLEGATARIEAALDSALARRRIGGRVVTARYGWQYAGIIIDGARLVYVNGFSTANITLLTGLGWDLRYQAGRACDGGVTFFGAVWDPSTHQLSNLRFNGNGWGAG
jgi:hypothetical protein